MAFEAGEGPLPLTTGSYDLRLDGSRLLFQVWTTDRNLVRRVTTVQSELSGQLNLAIERFGRRPGVMQLLDTSRPWVDQATTNILQQYAWLNYAMAQAHADRNEQGMAQRYARQGEWWQRRAAE